MNVELKNPTGKQAFELTGMYDAKKWQGIIDNADIFATAWDGQTLIGLRYIHGDTNTWFAPLLFVHEDYRSRGVGAALRELTFQECVKQSIGEAKIYTQFGGPDVYWEDDEYGKVTVETGALAVKHIQGRLRE